MAEQLIEQVLKMVEDENKISKELFGKYEVWRKIVDYPNYSISSFGNVRNNMPTQSARS